MPGILISSRYTVTRPGPHDSGRPRGDPHHHRPQAPQHARGELGPRRRSRAPLRRPDDLHRERDEEPAAAHRARTAAHHARTRLSALFNFVNERPVESAGFAAGFHDGHPPGPAGGHRCRLCDHRAPEADQEPDLRDRGLESCRRADEAVLTGLPLPEQQGADHDQAASPRPRDGDDRGRPESAGRHHRLGRERGSPRSPALRLGRPHGRWHPGAGRRLPPLGPPLARAPDVPLHEQHHPRHDAAQGALAPASGSRPRPLCRAGPHGRDPVHVQRTCTRGRLSRPPADHRRPQGRSRRTRSSGQGRSTASRFPRGRTSSRSVRRTSPATRRLPRRARPSKVDRQLHPARSGADHGSQRPAVHGARRDGRAAVHLASRQTGTARGTARCCGCAHRRTPGTYRLVVAEHGHSTAAVVRVRAK